VAGVVELGVEAVVLVEPVVVVVDVAGAFVVAVTLEVPGSGVDVVPLCDELVPAVPGADVPVTGIIESSV
jgi:hypothetical protein